MRAIPEPLLGRRVTSLGRRLALARRQQAQMVARTLPEHPEPLEVRAPEDMMARPVHPLS